MADDLTVLIAGHAAEHAAGVATESDGEKGRRPDR